MDISNAPMGPRRRATVEIGEEHDWTHLIERVLDDASGRRSAVKVFGTDYPTADSTAVRYYIHVCDLARVTGREDPVRDGLRRAKIPRFSWSTRTSPARQWAGRTSGPTSQ